MKFYHKVLLALGIIYVCLGIAFLFTYIHKVEPTEYDFEPTKYGTIDKEKTLGEIIRAIWNAVICGSASSITTI